MPELITGVEAYAPWLYGLLGCLAVRELWVARRALRGRRAAAFGVEREAYLGRYVRSLVTLLLLMTIGFGIFTVASVVAPTLTPDQRRQTDHDVPFVAPTVLAPVPTNSPTRPRATHTPVLPDIVTITPAPGTAAPP
ncbi:MAG: hypothetical protein IPG72_02585 [Ardenticatenales bacterium]|jgi:hypothetical protein|nr:hypothetical protein [Ardenticatenales bacterium]